MKPSLAFVLLYVRGAVELVISACVLHELESFCVSFLCIPHISWPFV